jgi:hypothetical protein
MGDDYDEGTNNPEFQQGIFQCSSEEKSQTEYLTFTKLHDNKIGKFPLQ